MRPDLADESSSAVDPSLFRRAAGRFATGICVVTTRSGDLDHAMTVNAFTSVSLDPILVLICVEIEARFHDAVLAAGFWGVSVLDGDGRPAADWLASRGRPLHGQLERIPHHFGPVTGTALLDQALATLEVRTTGVYPGGDHSIVVGEVVGLAARDTAGSALLYHRGAYRRLE